MPITKPIFKEQFLWNRWVAPDELVYAMDQAMTPPMEQYGPWGNTVTYRASDEEGAPIMENKYAVAGGYCLGLSLCWLAARKRGEDFVYDKVNKICHYPPWEATAIQSVYNGQPRGETIGHLEREYAEERCIKIAARILNLNLSPGVYRSPYNIFLDYFDRDPGQESPPSYFHRKDPFYRPRRSNSKIKPLKLKLDKGLMLISLISSDFGCHAVAMHYTDEGLYFFDPNYGLFYHSDKEKFGSWMSIYSRYSEFLNYWRVSISHVI